MSSSRRGWAGWRILRELSALGTRAAPPLLPLLPPLPRRTHNFNPPRLQEGISLAAFDAADEKWSKKAPWRCPAGSRPSRLQRLYATTTRLSRACLCPPLALFPQHFLLSSSHWACQEATFTPGPFLWCITFSCPAQWWV